MHPYMVVAPRDRSAFILYGDRVVDGRYANVLYGSYRGCASRTGRDPRGRRSVCLQWSCRVLENTLCRYIRGLILAAQTGLRYPRIAPVARTLLPSSS